MFITDETLDLVFRGFRTTVDDACMAAQVSRDRIARTVPSASREEQYGWLGNVPGMRERLGPRVVHRPKADGFSIVNKKFESTVAVRREDIADDRRAGRSRAASTARPPTSSIPAATREARNRAACRGATGPVQEELIRNREVLGAMTGRQRAEAEALIRTIEAEREAVGDLEQARNMLARASYDALEGMILRGEEASDVMRDLAGTIGQAVLQSALPGDGPLAGLLGTDGSGGLLGMAIGAVLPGTAEGGTIYGAGGPADDAVPILASPGEFVVNAAAARRNRALLEAINAGAPTSPQGGGVTGESGGAGRTDPLTLAVDVAVDVDVHPSGEFDTRVQATARDVSVQVVDEYDRPIAPGTFRRIRDDPRRTGGGSPRPAQSGHTRPLPGSNRPRRGVRPCEN